VTRIAAQDPEALSLLYDRHRGIIMALALKILGNRAEAEEVLGAVFIQAWKEAVAYDHGRGSVQGWLAGLGRRMAIDRLRRRGPGIAGRKADPREEAGRPLDDTAHAEKRRLVLGALGDLSQEHRALIDIAYYGVAAPSKGAEDAGKPGHPDLNRIREAIVALRLSLERRIAS